MLTEQQLKKVGYIQKRLQNIFMMESPLVTEGQVEEYALGVNRYSKEDIDQGIEYMVKNGNQSFWPNVSILSGYIRTARAESGRSSSGAMLGSNDDAAMKHIGFGTIEEYKADADNKVLELVRISKQTSG